MTRPGERGTDAPSPLGEIFFRLRQFSCERVTLPLQNVAHYD